MKNKKTEAKTPEYRRQMPPPRPLPDLDELSRETDSAPIYRKATEGMATQKRLIDANSIPYHETTECHGHGLFFMEQTVNKEEIDQMPTIDAVEVVRCKDCKYYNGEGCLKTYGEFEPDQMDFCSYGERRDST